MSLSWYEVKLGDYVGYKFISTIPGMEDVNGCFIANVVPQDDNGILDNIDIQSFGILEHINLRDLKSYTPRNQLDEIRLELKEQNFVNKKTHIYQPMSSHYHIELLFVGQTYDEVEYFFVNNLPEELI
ncbi:hypothetical protein [Vibrio phage phiKT1024]|nr:hypothetical protein [Vibrio phage phiKT1024]